MKLTKGLYRVLEMKKEEQEFFAHVELDPDHQVFQGHFPGHPVTPGVIQLRMVHELLEMYFQKPLTWHQTVKCKFVNLLNPLEDPIIDIDVSFIINMKTISVKAQITKGPVRFLEYSGTYIVD